MGFSDMHVGKFVLNVPAPRRTMDLEVNESAEWTAAGMSLRHDSRQVKLLNIY